MFDRLLHVPPFPRMHDYFGLWCMEPGALTSFVDLVSRTDMRQHVAAFRPPVPPQPTAEQAPAKGGKTTAVIRIAGTMAKSAGSFGGSSTVQTRREVRAAVNDPNVSGILLAIDSPGGNVAGTADLAADVKAARRKKPVWAHIDDLGASAAYWVASQADQVFANTPTALVGSIGTYGSVMDMSAAAERAGIRVHVFRTGPLKGAGSPGDVVTDEQLAHMQKRVDDTQTHFDDAVRKGRGLTAAQMDAVRTGGVWLAEEAKSLRLIDGVRSLESTLAALAAAS
jgi:signal peptide peptidase SppA